MGDVVDFRLMLDRVEVGHGGVKKVFGQAVDDALRMMAQSAQCSGKRSTATVKITLEPNEETGHLDLRAEISMKLPEPPSRPIEVYTEEDGQLLLFPVPQARAV